jgi:hypothetical protein
MRVIGFTKRGWWVALLLTMLGIAGCGHPAPARSEAKRAVPVVDTVPQRRDADDTARFLAGMPGKPGSPFGALEATTAWKEHRRVLDEAWKGTEGSLIAGLGDFQKHELAAGAISDAPVFYPFAGPDALTPVQFFPHTSSYVMVALEPPGTLPTPRQLEKKKLEVYFPKLRTTMGSVLGRSFFVTRDMDRQFRGQVTDGLMIPILEILVRTGHTVNGFRYITLNDAGQFVDRPADWKAPGKHGNKGVEISFRRDSDQSLHRLVYLSVNLDDKHLSDNDAFRKYAATLKGSTTIFKATSYMTHHKDFSIIRDIALNESSAVLQDDSGLPYRLFDAQHWRVQLYGEYTKPYGSFRWLEQKDLREAYKTAGVKPLPMRIGYGYGKAASNLLLAKRAGS